MTDIHEYINKKLVKFKKKNLKYLPTKHKISKFIDS